MVAKGIYSGDFTDAVGEEVVAWDDRFHPAELRAGQVDDVSFAIQERDAQDRVAVVGSIAHGFVVDTLDTESGVLDENRDFFDIEVESRILLAVDCGMQ